MPDNMPKHTLWWGVAVSLVGALIVAFAPPVLFSSGWVETGPGYTFVSVGLVVLDPIRELLLPLGTALIGASIVMFYIRARAGSTQSADRPKRWVLPDPPDRRTDG